jgi:predicted RNase H-like nuclease (RuvC/YqgF family)
MTMTQNQDGFSDYVRRVAESTKQYAKDLLQENEQLLGLAISVHDDKLRLERELVAAREQLIRQKHVQSSLVERISKMEESNKEFAERYVDVEQLTSNLANLYVATYRLHGSLERDQVLATMTEIVINLVGSEEFAIFELQNDALTVAASVGVDTAHLTAGHRMATNAREAIAKKAIYVAAKDGVPVHSNGTDVTVCIPLEVGGTLIGAIVIFRLLAHKERLEPHDQELFNLLATHAATALHASTLHGLRSQVHA